MFDIGWTEMLVVACVAIIVVGPKDLPKMLRSVGKTIKKVRGMAGDFQRQFNDALKESELDELKDDVMGSQTFAPVADAKKAMEDFKKNVGENVFDKIDDTPDTKAVAEPAISKKTAAKKAPAKKGPAKAKPAAKKATAKKAPAKPAASKPAAKAAAKPAASKPAAKAAAKPAAKKAAPRKKVTAVKDTVGQQTKSSSVRKPAAKKPAAKAKDAAT